MNNFTMIPRYAVLDPEVTYTLPPSLTATTGMDALTHAVEAYIGGSTTKETRTFVRKAVKLIFANIERAYKESENPPNHSPYAAGAWSQSWISSNF